MFRPATIRVGDLEADPACVRASHAVVELRLAGQTAQLACTADAKASIRSKLEGEAAVADEALCWPVGSSFEADLLCATLSRVRLPTLHTQGVGRSGVWWLALDLDAPGSGWQTLAEPAIAGGSRSVGPFLDKASAARWSAMLDARFELCRYPAELRKAPMGTPCSYKQMGLCPAACDGSEPMHAYLSRAMEAMAFDAAALGRLRTELADAIEAAAADRDFELAGRLRDELAGLPEPGKLGPVGPAARFGCLAVGRSERSGWVRLIALGLGGWSWVADVKGSACDEAGASRLVEACRSAEPAGDDGWVTGLVAREAARPRRGGPVLLAKASLDAGAVLSAVRRVARIRDA